MEAFDVLTWFGVIGTPEEKKKTCFFVKKNDNKKKSLDLRTCKHAWPCACTPECPLVHMAKTQTWHVLQAFRQESKRSGSCTKLAPRF